jgi:glycosyltransferase 2 family protein
MRKAILFLAKAAVSGLLLYFALNWVSIGTVVNRISRIDLHWVVLVLIIMLAQQILLTLRWQKILIQCGGEFSFPRLFRFNMIGAFFTQTLPSSVGGDAVRLWLVAKQTNWRIAGYSVLLDRVIGVAALAIFVVASLPWSLELIHNAVGRSALLVLGLGSLAGGIIFVGSPWSRLRLFQRWPVTRHFAAVAAVGATIVRSPSSFPLLLGLSIFVHLLSVVMAWSLARSVDAQLPFQYALLLIPPVILVTVFPISIAGWGVREGAMVAAFAYAGLAQSDGLIVSLLFGLSSLLIGAVGGVIWIFQIERADRTQIAAQASD